MVEEHHGFFFGLSGGGLLFFQQFFGLQKRVGVSFNLGGFPTEVNTQTLHLFAVPGWGYSFQIVGELRLKVIEEIFFFVREKSHLGKDIVDQLKIESGLNGPLIGLLLEIGINVQRHCHVRLRRHVVTCGPPLAGNNDRSGLYQRCKDTLDGGRAFREVHAGFDLASGGVRMVVQELEYFVLSGHGLSVFGSNLSLFRLISQKFEP